MKWLCKIIMLGANLNHFQTSRVSQLSAIGFLMNCLKMVTSDYHKLYHLPRSLNDMHIVSGITLHLMLLMIVIFSVDRYNQPLMKDDWYFQRCKLTRLISLFICWNWTIRRCSFGRNKPKEQRERTLSLVIRGRWMQVTRFWPGNLSRKKLIMAKTLWRSPSEIQGSGARKLSIRQSVCCSGTTGQTGVPNRSDRSLQPVRSVWWPTPDFQAEVSESGYLED